MTACQILKAEHDRIAAVVNVLEAIAAGVDNGQLPAPGTIAGAVEFLRGYADQLHHGKEEALFFPRLVERGVPSQGCPIGGLTHEHEKGRALVSALAEWSPAPGQGPRDALPALREILRGLVALYRDHLWKEDEMVFPMADRFLTPADQAELSRQFAELDQSFGPEAVRRLEQLAEELTLTAG